MALLVVLSLDPLPGTSVIVLFDLINLQLLISSFVVQLVSLCTSTPPPSWRGFFLLLLLSLPLCYYTSFHTTGHYMILYTTWPIPHIYSILFDWFICCSSSGSSSRHFIDCPSGSRYHHWVQVHSFPPNLVNFFEPELLLLTSCFCFSLQNPPHSLVFFGLIINEGGDGRWGRWW